MTRLFDSYIVVDRSANGELTRGYASLWWCEVCDKGDVRNLRDPSARVLVYDGILSGLYSDVGKTAPRISRQPESLQSDLT